MNKLLCSLLLFAAAAASAHEDLVPSAAQTQAARLSAELLGEYHYRKLPIDDALSQQVFDHFLKALDREKHFFTQADIDELSAYRNRLDDAVLGENLRPAFAIFNRYAQRAEARYTLARALLKSSPDFRRDESFTFQRDAAPWPASDAEVRELWRLRVKNDWLNLRLAGKDDAAIVATLDRRYEQSLRRIGQLKSADAFQAFMSTFATTVEPHTDYLGPRASENFDISMRLSLFGIGAVLQDKDEYTTIRELTPGGPAALSGKLKAGDRIVGVGQGDGAMTDVLGWRLDDTVGLIRGPADSTVRLEILPGDAGPAGERRVVSLVRKKINLESQAARQRIIDVADAGGQARRIGIIELPAFYQDFAARQRGDADYRSATRDVARRLDELKAAKVDGVLLDLRNNGGGSLQEAVELTGLFIESGPVVQERSANGRLVVDSDGDPTIAWDGPFAVLINRGSASASEIFAAAIQDYGRGVVIGETSYGKGSVQTVINLDQITRSPHAAFGELKLTIAQFFRINGSTTQRLGVQPDIAFPEFSDPANFGESSQDNALPWTRVRALPYERWADLAGILPELRSRHAARSAASPEFRDLVEASAEFKRLSAATAVSLNEATRRAEQAASQARRSARGGPAAAAGDGETDEPPSGAAAKPDALLDAAARIVGDAAALLAPPAGAPRAARPPATDFVQR